MLYQNMNKSKSLKGAMKNLLRKKVLKINRKILQTGTQSN